MMRLFLYTALKKYATKVADICFSFSKTSHILGLANIKELYLPHRGNSLFDLKSKGIN